MPEPVRRERPARAENNGGPQPGRLISGGTPSGKDMGAIQFSSIHRITDPDVLQVADAPRRRRSSPFRELAAEIEPGQEIFASAHLGPEGGLSTPGVAMPIRAPAPPLPAAQLADPRVAQADELEESEGVGELQPESLPTREGSGQRRRSRSRGRGRPGRAAQHSSGAASPEDAERTDAAQGEGVVPEPGNSLDANEPGDADGNTIRSVGSANPTGATPRRRRRRGRGRGQAGAPSVAS
jgi:hypothetical protein